MTEAQTLASLQTWFVERITERSRHSVAPLIRPSRRMTAVERLEVYRVSYVARLVECLADDYPTVRHALGDDEFEALAREYIRTHPSDSPNLNRFGASFSGFVAKLGDRDDGAFLAELSRLEWAMVEVVHAPTVPSLSFEALQRVPPGESGDLRLEPRPTLRLLDFAHPVNAYLQAVREDQRPTSPLPRRSRTAVYRVGMAVWRMDLTPSMAVVLRALVKGEPLASAVARSSEDGPRPEESDIQTWFTEWVSEGFFAELIPNPPERRGLGAPAAHPRRPKSKRNNKET